MLNPDDSFLLADELWERRADARIARDDSFEHGTLHGRMEETVDAPHRGTRQGFSHSNIIVLSAFSFELVDKLLHIGWSYLCDNLVTEIRLDVMLDVSFVAVVCALAEHGRSFVFDEPLIKPLAESHA